MSRYTVPLVTLHPENTKLAYKPDIFASKYTANRRHLSCNKKQKIEVHIYVKKVSSYGSHLMSIDSPFSTQYTTQL